MNEHGVAQGSHCDTETKPAVDCEIVRLERALQIATAANEAKSRYLATASHEIRSPLNVILGYAQMIERGGVSAQEAARIIRRSTEHLTRLVEGLLDMSQVENGVLRLRIEPVDLAAFMENLVSMMRPSATAKGIDLRYDPPQWMPAFVNMDQSRLQQVLINLLSNAIKFTDHGWVTLKLRYASQVATFEISDTGPGIAAADQGRIFEAFQRGENTVRGSRPGVGLGLTISRAIVAILGGQLELETSHGTGSCFRIKLMLGETGGPAAPRPQAAGMVSQDGRKSILVVDDDPEQLALIEQLLQAQGLSVVAVGSGREALRRSAEQHFDLAILDVSLGDISGWDLATRLRRDVGDDVRIMMLTANAHELHRLDISEASHDFFLLKPVDFDVLTNAVANLLRLELTSTTTEIAPAARRKAKASLNLSDAALVHVVRIRELLRIGYVRGIEAEIALLGAHGPETAGLVDQLYGSLDRFDLAGMEQTLERL